MCTHCVWLTFPDERMLISLLGQVDLLGGFRQHVVSVLGAWEILRAYHSFKRAPKIVSSLGSVQKVSSYIFGAGKR